MRSRTVWFVVWAVLGVTLVVAGWLVPTHLRAVDGSVLRQAGRRTPSIVDQGLALADKKNPGAAQLIWLAAQKQHLAGHDKLGSAVAALRKERGPWQLLGSAQPSLEHLFAAEAATPGTNPPAFTEIVIRREVRARALEFLKASQQVEVQALLRCRTLTNTVLMPASSSAAGQAFDTAVIICGLLVKEQCLTPELSRQLMVFAFRANQEGKTEEIERVLLDLMSLGQRLNWGQLTVLTAQARDAEALRLLAGILRAGADLPTVLTAVHATGRPTAVAQYCVKWSRTGVDDLGRVLRYNSGGVTELVKRNARLYVSSRRERAAQYRPLVSVANASAELAWRRPGLALGLRLFLYFGGGCLLALAARQVRPVVSALERPLQVRGFHIARETLFGLGFLVVMLLLSEPFLAQESQKVELPLHVRLPTVGRVMSAGNAPVQPFFMNQSLLTLLLFFVLQGLIYVACLVKLAEIRRQRVPARVKVRLLENEEHLFDAGLYLGFVGTIISLILTSLGITKLSLMAAYSSTSFGIIFVSVFKIFHLRPARRKLLLESEADDHTAPAPPAARALTTAS